MGQDVVIVLNCGATNIQAIAINTRGEVVARASENNFTVPSEENPDWQTWSADDIFNKFSRCTRQLMNKLQPEQVKAITVTSFGVDGTLVDEAGNLLYPVISWNCPRTDESQQSLQKYLDPDWLAGHSGVGHFAFNTIYKLIWFKENRPELLQDAYAWLFISSIFNQKLTGKFTTDATMAGSSQLVDLHQQDFSEVILKALHFDRQLFPAMVQAGEVIGELLPESAETLGLNAGIPVVSSGHDTQFVIYGSGAKEGQPVLFSGTWEILMARTAQVGGLNSSLFEHGFSCQLDSHKGFYNPGIRWLASGVLEWISKHFYRELEGDEKYQAIITEAEEAGSEAQGVTVNPSFLSDRYDHATGAIQGLTLDTERGSVYRATLNALADRLKESLKQLEHIGGFESTELILTGRGTRNTLWNQIKADTLQLPVKTLDEPDISALGASMFAMTGAGLYSTPQSARNAFNIVYETVLPGERSVY